MLQVSCGPGSFADRALKTPHIKGLDPKDNSKFYGKCGEFKKARKARKLRSQLHVLSSVDGTAFSPHLLVSSPPTHPHVAYSSPSLPNHHSPRSFLDPIRHYCFVLVMALCRRPSECDGPVRKAQ